MRRCRTRTGSPCRGVGRGGRAGDRRCVPRDRVPSRAVRRGPVRIGPGCPGIGRWSRRTTAGSGRRSADRTWCYWLGMRPAGGACAGWCPGRTWRGRRRCRRSRTRCWRRTRKGWSPCRGAGTGSWRGACWRAIARGHGRRRSGTRGCSGVRAGAGAGARMAARRAPVVRRIRPPAAGSSWSSRTTCSRTTTGWPRRRRASPRSWGCPWWSPTMSTTRCPRIASCRT